MRLDYFIYQIRVESILMRTMHRKCDIFFYLFVSRHSRTCIIQLLLAYAIILIVAKYSKFTLRIELSVDGKWARE